MLIFNLKRQYLIIEDYPGLIGFNNRELKLLIKC